MSEQTRDSAFAAALQAELAKVARRGCAPFNPNDRLEDDLGLDSLDFLRLVQLMESRFGIILPDNETAQIVTIADLAALIAESIDRKTSTG